MNDVQRHNIRFTLRKVRGLTKAERAEFYAYARLGGFALVRPIWFAPLPPPFPNPPPSAKS